LKTFFEKLYDDKLFQSKLNGVMRKKYIKSHALFNLARMSFEDIMQEIWIYIIKSAPDKEPAFYMHVAIQGFIDLLRAIDADYGEYYEIEYKDDGVYPESNTLRFAQFQFVSVKLMDRHDSKVHLAYSFNSRESLCGKKWNEDVSYDIPDEISCPECLAKYNQVTNNAKESVV
jgi:hypothetical protein